MSTRKKKCVKMCARKSGRHRNRSRGKGACVKVAISKPVRKKGAGRRVRVATTAPRRTRSPRNDGAYLRGIRIFVESVRDRAQRHELRVYSRLTKVAIIKEKCGQLFNESVEHIKLFHGGKQLEDQKFLYDYGIRLDNTLMMHIAVHPNSVQSSANQVNSSEASEDSREANLAEANVSEASESTARMIPAKDDDVEQVLGAEFSNLFKEGDIVDVRHAGAWHEAIVQIIARKKVRSVAEATSSGPEDGSANAVVTSDNGVAKENDVLDCSTFTNANSACDAVASGTDVISLLEPVVDKRSSSLELPDSKKQYEVEEVKENDSAATEDTSGVRDAAFPDGAGISVGTRVETVSTDGLTLAVACDTNKAELATNVDGSTFTNADSACGAVANGTGVIALLEPVVDTRSNSLDVPDSKKHYEVEEVKEDAAAIACSIDDGSNSTARKSDSQSRTYEEMQCEDDAVKEDGGSSNALPVAIATYGREVDCSSIDRSLDNSGTDHVSNNPVVSLVSNDTSEIETVRSGSGQVVAIDIADVVYYVQYVDRSVSTSLIRVQGDNIRPRATEKVHVKDLKTGDKVMVSYNMDNDRLRGDWYDATVTKVEYQEMRGRTNVKFVVNLLADDSTVLQVNCKIVTTQEIYKIPEPGTQKNVREVGMPSLDSLREVTAYCEQCNDDPDKRCDACSCTACKGKHDETLLLVCEECNTHCHIYCLRPPLAEVPADDWYCASCKNDADIVRAGEEPRISRRQANAPSANPRNPNRDWDQGMACSGRTKTCTVVPKNHFGKVPGTRVGMSWRYRMQASEVGLHVPHVGGIHGRCEEGAFSLCLAGGYEGDVDHGDWFYYTGSGGRDLKTGNKRTLSRQTSDQQLTRMNRALAKNITDQPVNPNGAKAKDWKASRPVRVLRSAGCSEYAPETGHRYDGIYRVVRYWQEKSVSGFKVWRYELRRDDDEPAPWTDEGKAYIKKHNLEFEIPDHQKKRNTDKDNGDATTPKKRAAAGASEGASEGASANKKSEKRDAYKPSAYILSLIQEDKLNTRLWNDVLTTDVWTEREFLQKVSTAFLCSVCQELVSEPVTMDCLHTVCKACLKNSMRAGVFTCPQCRHHLGKDYKLNVNEKLCSALGAMFPTNAKRR